MVQLDSQLSQHPRCISPPSVRRVREHAPDSMRDDLCDHPISRNERAFAEGFAGSQDWAVIGRERSLDKDPVCDSSILCKRDCHEVCLALEVVFFAQGRAPIDGVKSPCRSSFFRSGVREMEAWRLRVWQVHVGLVLVLCVFSHSVVFRVGFDGCRLLVVLFSWFLPAFVSSL